MSEAEQLPALDVQFVTAHVTAVEEAAVRAVLTELRMEESRQVRTLSRL